MKTKLLISILVFVISANTFSQEYHPFLNHSSWLTYGGTGCCLPYVEKTIEQGNEEIIGGKTYTKFIDPWSVYGDPVVYLREDVAARKVWHLVNGTEVLLYDFSLQLADTVIIGGDEFAAPDTFTVTEVDSIMVNGEPRKRINLKGTQEYCGQQLTQIWIEGIGSGSHPLDPGWNMYGAVCSAQGGWFIHSACTFQNGVHIYGNPNCTEYHPFLNNSSWIVYQSINGQISPDKVIKSDGDEIIENVSYKKFIDPYNNNSAVYLRENITEKTVYKLVNVNSDIVEPLYNFNLKSGDQFGAFTATVDSIVVNGGTRKRITLKSTESEIFCNKSATQVWIEGIGSVSHPLNPGYNMIAEACSPDGGSRVFTKCSFQNGVHIFGNSDCDLSQEVYHPLLNNSTWIINDFVSCCQEPTLKKIELATDEVINGVTYKKFIDPFAVDGVNTDYLREDVNTQKVYKLINGTEVLLYDFSLETSDTISYGPYHFTATVDDINVIGGIRKRITLKSSEQVCDQNLTMVWIEGVGTDRHPFYPDFNILAVCSSGGGYNIATRCSFQNGVHVYGPEDCDSILLSAPAFEAANIQLFPNPASDIVQINSQNSTDNLDRITVYDMLGKIVQKVNGIAASHSVLSVGSLSKGIYLMEITTQSRMKTTKKLIIK